MKNILLTILFICALKGYSQTSFNEKSGNWVTNSTWTNNSAPGTTDVQNVNITIGGTVTRNGNLGFKNNANLIIDNNTDGTDTLIVRGNLTFNNGTNLTIRGSSILIVIGDLVSNNNINVVSTGKLVVTGSAITGNNTNVTNSGDFYIFGANSLGGGGGSNYNGSQPGNAEDLKNNDQALADYLVNDLGVNNSTLPISLKSFSASIKFDNVHLDWVTAKEENFSHFEVERTTDNVNYEPIAFVQGQGESLSDIHYEFMDDNAPYGVVYYRLKSVDNDGTSEYSWIISVKKGLEGKVNISPNPASATENIKVTLPGQFEGKIAVVSIYDLNGTVIQKMYDVDAQQPLKIKSVLKAGMYLIKVQHNGLEENMRLLIR